MLKQNRFAEMLLYSYAIIIAKIILLYFSISNDSMIFSYINIDY